MQLRQAAALAHRAGGQGFPRLPRAAGGDHVLLGHVRHEGRGLPQGCPGLLRVVQQVAQGQVVAVQAGQRHPVAIQHLGELRALVQGEEALAQLAALGAGEGELADDAVGVGGDGRAEEHAVSAKFHGDAASFLNCFAAARGFAIAPCMPSRRLLLVWHLEERDYSGSASRISPRSALSCAVWMRDWM